MLTYKPKSCRKVSVVRPRLAVPPKGLPKVIFVSSSSLPSRDYSKVLTSQTFGFDRNLSRNRLITCIDGGMSTRMHTHTEMNVECMPIY